MQVNHDPLVRLSGQLEALKTTLHFMAGVCMDAHAANTHHTNSTEFATMDAAITKLERLVDDGSGALDVITRENTAWSRSHRKQEVD